MKKKIAVWFPIALFFVFSTMFYGPLGIYLSNSEELWFSVWDVLKITGTVSLVMLAAALVFGIVMPEKISMFFAKLLWGGSLALYLQGNFVNINYGVMDGTEIVWGNYTKYACVDTALWIFCLALPFILAIIPKIKKEKYDKKILVVLSCIFIAMQLPALAMQLIGYHPNAQQKLTITTDGIYELGNKENVVVFVLDTFDEKYYRKYIQGDAEYESKYTDFVHNDNVMTSAARTILAIPSMFGGKPFQWEGTYSEYIKEIWGGENIFRKMHEEGIDVRVFSETTYFSNDIVDSIENFSDTEPIDYSVKILGKKLYKMAGFIFAPHVAKKYFWFNTSEFEQAKEKATNIYSVNDKRFFENYRQQGFTVSPDYERAFRFYHLHGAHKSFNLGVDGREDDAANVETQIKGNLTVIGEMIEEMKEKGVYDDATILVTADHGDDKIAHHPIFILKEAHHTGEYSDSHLPISLFDMPYIIGDAFGIDMPESEYGLHMSDLSEDMERTRYFFKNGSDNSRVQVTEYMTTSDAYDEEAITKVGEFKNDKIVPYVLGTRLSFAADGTGNVYTTKGFANNTGFRTKMKGPEAILEIPFAEVPDKETLTVHFMPNLNEAPTANVNLYANGELVYTASLTTADNRNMQEFEMPTSLIADAEGNVLTLRFEFPDITKKKKDSMGLISLQID